jgi:hypothetical protein
METKDPVLLVVLVETSRLRWFVAGIGLNGEVIPLVCSEEGNLSPYLDLAFDDQVAFLRHRLCGVLQRGCDRLWPCQVVFVLERPLTEGPDDLTRRVAEHMVDWMSKPPLAFFLSADGLARDKPPRLLELAGAVEPLHRELLESRLGELCAATAEASMWELSRAKR